MAHTGKVVIVFRSATLGDFVMSAPALRMIREKFIGDRIILLTVPSTNKAIRDAVARYSPESSAPWVNLIVPHLVDEALVLDGTNLLRDAVAIRKEIQQLDVRLAIMLVEPGAPWLGRVKKVMLLMFICGWVHVLGWRQRGSIHGDRSALRRAGLLKHHVHGPLQFLREMDPPQLYEEADIVFDLRPSLGAVEMAMRHLSHPNLLGRRLVAVAPGSIQSHKRWPIAKFQELCRTLLLENADVALVVVGTQTDRALADDICSIDPLRCVNMAGATNVQELAALLRRCHLLVGNDGGSMHLGDAMGCKVVSIVPGIQYPDSIEPWNSRQLAVRHYVDCAPCYDFQKCPLGHNRCMSELPVTQVLDQCRKVLAAESQNVGESISAA